MPGKKVRLNDKVCLTALCVGLEIAQLSYCSLLWHHGTWSCRFPILQLVLNWRWGEELEARLHHAVLWLTVCVCWWGSNCSTGGLLSLIACTSHQPCCHQQQQHTGHHKDYGNGTTLQMHDLSYNQSINQSINWSFNKPKLMNYLLDQ